MTILVLLAIATIGCSGESRQDTGGNRDRGLSEEQLEHGIGPVSGFDLEPFDPELARRGAIIFDQRCVACHRIGERRIGPDLSGLLDRRSPAYVMNMILNPEEMIERHPEARALLREYGTPMADQNLSESEARAILEWLRESTTRP